MFSQDLQNQFDSLLPTSSSPSGSGATRRTALKLALGASYAATAMPIMAQTAITTPAEGLATGQEIFDSAGATVPFYYAMPQGKTNLPVVLVVHEIFGVHAYIADVCRRFAKAGYLAIAPDLFARYGDASGYSDMAKLMSDLVSKVPDEEVADDLTAALDWAAANGGDLQRVGITGFCWGGRQVWLFCEKNTTVKAGVAWYGRLVGTPSAWTPKHPLDLAAELKAPVLGLYGGKDSGIPLSTLEDMKNALSVQAGKGNAAAKGSEFVVYPDAPHAFHADYRPSYRKQAAEDGFQRALAWFKTKGVA